MSDQVGNPEDRFSHNKAHISSFDFVFQAQVVGDELNRVGLVPSKNLEENRKAFVRSDMDYSKSSLCK